MSQINGTFKGTWNGNDVLITVQGDLSITPIAATPSLPAPPAVTPAPPAPQVPVASTLKALGYVGINLESHDDWHMDRYYVDVMKGSRGFSSAVDAKGWPTAPWQVVLSTKNGNCPPGTYKGRYLGAVGKQVQASSGCTLTETSIAGGYVNFDLMVPSPYVAAVGNVIISGAAGVTGIEIVRPGFMPGDGNFWNPASLAYLKFASSIRYMKPLAVECGGNQPNGAEVLGGVWATRNTPDNRRGGFSGIGMPHEWIIDQANTLRPLGNLKQIWVNFFHNASDDYVTQCATLYRDKLNAALTINFEPANEAWNDSYSSVVNFFRMRALAEIQGAYAKSSGAGFTNRFASIVGDGKNVTVTLVDAHLRKTGDPISMQAPAGFTCTNAPCVVISPNALSYPQTGVGSVSITNGALYVGLPNTGVSYDGNLNINMLMRRAYMSRVREIGLLIEKVFGSSVAGRARMIAGQQQSDGNPNGGMAEGVFKYIEDVFPARKLSTIVYGIALHPYTDQALPNAAATVADYKALLDASIARNTLELKRFMNLNICHGMKTVAYEWGPSFLNNGVAGHTAVQLATQKDDLMRQHTEATWQAYANVGMEVQHFFHYTPCDDWNVADPTAADGNLNWYTNGDPGTLAATPKTKAVNNALNIVPTVNDALNLISGAASTIDAQNRGRVDLPVPGNNLGWTVPPASTAGVGNLGYDRAGSMSAIGAVARWIEFGVLIYAAGKYTLNVWARVSNDKGTPEAVTLTLDDAPLCVYPLAGCVGGNFINNACAAGSTEVAVVLPAGFHRLRASVPGSASGAAAIRKIVATKVT